MVVDILIFKNTRQIRNMTSKNTEIKKLEARIKKIESILFTNKVKTAKSKKTHIGLVGGLTFLIEKGFFNKPKLVTEIQDELQKEGYYHPIQSTDTILRRDMVNRKKILTRLKINGVWQYALRK